MSFINKKIEKIRQQPEEVRMRWAWLLTTVFMIFVFVIWGVLLKAEKGFEKESVIPENQREALRELSGQKKSMGDTADGMQEITD